MYRRPKFLEILLEIREQMSREVDYDVDLFAETVRSGKISAGSATFTIEKRQPESSTVKKEAGKGNSN